MSKSTPLSQFTGIGETNPINNMEKEKENQLVEEILTEINNDSNENTQNLMMELNDTENEEQVVSPPKYSEQEVVKPTAADLSDASQNLTSRNTEGEEEEESLKSIQDELLSRIKLPLLAGAVVVLFSVPMVSDVLTKLIPKKELFTKNMNLMILVVKFILSSIVFMGVQFAL